MKQIIPLPFFHPAFNFLPFIFSCEKSKTTVRSDFEKTRMSCLHTFTGKQNYQVTNIGMITKTVTVATLKCYKNLTNKVKGMNCRSYIGIVL